MALVLGRSSGWNHCLLTSGLSFWDVGLWSGDEGLQPWGREAVAAVKQLPVFMCHTEVQLCCISESIKKKIVMLVFMENKAVCDGQCQV